MKHFLTFLSVVLLPLACVGAPSYTTYFNNTHTYTNASVAGTARVNSLVVTNGISSAANWTASGATNSTLPGVASANRLVATNNITSVSGTFVGHPADSAVFYGTDDFFGLSYIDVVSTATLSSLETYIGVYNSGTPTTRAFTYSFASDTQVQYGAQKVTAGVNNGRAYFGIDSSSPYLAFGLTSDDTYLRRDAANTLAIRNGTTAQALNIYNTFTDSSNYERCFIGWSGNILFLGSSSAGTGSARDTKISSGLGIYFRTGGTDRWQVNGSGHLLAVADNTYDIGASGATRPRDVFVADDVVAGGDVTAGALLQNSGIRVMTPSSLQTLAAGNALLANATKVRVVGSGGAVTLTSTPTIADGSDGQYVMIQGTDNTNTLTVQDQGSLASSNLELGAATRVLGAGDVLVLTFDTTASVWYEVSFANN